MDLRIRGGGRVSWYKVREWHGHIYTTKHKIEKNEGPPKSLLSLANGPEKGQHIKLENLGNNTLFQPNTMKNCSLTPNPINKDQAGSLHFCLFLAVPRHPSPHTVGWAGVMVSDEAKWGQ